jgi:flagellar assembly protein FliH
MFDYSFDDGADEARQAKQEAELRAAQQAEENAPPTFSEDEMDAARKESHALGRQEGMSDAMASIEQQMSRTLDVVLTRIPTVFEQHQSWVREMEADSLRLAATIMRKLAPELTRDAVLPEVEHVIHEAFQFLTEQPKVMIRVADTLEAPLADKVNLMASRVGYEGQVVLVGDPELAEDDCRISWQAGAVERSLGETWKQIDEIIHRAVGDDPNPDKAADEDAVTEQDAAAEPDSETDAEVGAETDTVIETAATEDTDHGIEDEAGADEEAGADAEAGAPKAVEAGSS